MSKEQTLKTKNRIWLISYMLLHAVLFALFAAKVNPTFTEINSFLAKLKSPSGLFPLLSFPIAVVLEGLLNSNRKAQIVFWRIINPLPGCRAYTQIAPDDPRISMKAVRDMYPGGLPEVPQEQNAAWYKLYQQHKNKPIVYDANKSFLLTRDMVALTVVLLPFCLVAHLFWNSPAITIGYHFLLLISCVVLISLTAQNYGKRLVGNVFAETTAEKGKE